jgi:alcohol dehydrogenase
VAGHFAHHERDPAIGLFSPGRIVAVDLSDARLEAARRFGADVTVNDARDDPMTVIKR